MSFGRRLALYFVVIALVPTLALVGILVLVSEDSRKGKADASLAAGVETALAVYERDRDAARPEARALAGDPQLALGLEGGSAGELTAFAARAVAERSVEGVQVRDASGTALAAGGNPEAVAFAPIELTQDGQLTGTLAVSVTSASEYAQEARALTGNEVVLSRAGAPLEADVTPPASLPDPGETADVEVDGTTYRGHLLELSPDAEELLLLGPAREEGLLGVDTPAVGLLAVFLLLGVVFSYGLARTLTGLHEQVEEQAVTDPLTGLSNRRRMLERLALEVDRALRFEHELSLLVIDIDDFKQINDSLGHPQGDVVLKEIAETMRETTRLIDVRARYGGDELALLLLETGPEGGLILAERLRERVASRDIPRTSGDGSMHVTVSIGVATLTHAADDADGLLEAADQALLRGKRSGKNQTRVAPHGRTPSERPRSPEPEQPAPRP